MTHLLLALTSILSLVASAASFPDSTQSPFLKHIESLQDQEILHGYSDGTFRPQKSINRAEFLKILMVSAGDKVSLVKKNCFTDFKGTELWFWATACYAKEKYIVNGYADGSFQGEKLVNLAEALKMAERLWKVPEPKYFRAPDHWYDPFFDALSGTDILKPLNRDAGHYLNREEAAYIISKFQQVFGGKSSSSLISGGSKSAYTTSVCGNGKLESREQCDDGNLSNGDNCSSLCILMTDTLERGVLHIDQTSIASQDVVRGAKQVPMLGFRAIAGNQAVDMTSLVFEAGSGTLAGVQNFRLVFNTGGDSWQNVGQLGTINGNTVTFEPLAAWVRQGADTEFQLRADILPSASSASFSLQFKTSDSHYVTAVGREDDEELPGITTNGAECQSSSGFCWISVQTVSPTAIRVVSPNF